MHGMVSDGKGEDGLSGGRWRGVSWIRGMCYTLPGKRFPAKAGNICSLARGAFMAASSETHFREGTVLMLDNLCSKPIYLVRAFAETSERN